MDAVVRRRALAAAAKAAFSVTFLSACSAPNAEGRAGDTNDDVASGAAESADALHARRPSHSHHACDGGEGLPGDAGPETVTCDLPPAGSDAGASAAAVTCCIDLVASKVAADGGWPMLSASDAADPSVDACCRAIGEGYWSRGDFSGKDTQAFNACCSVKAIPGPTCTPWGPPMPPRFDAVAASAAFAVDTGVA